MVERPGKGSGGLRQEEGKKAQDRSYGHLACGPYGRPMGDPASPGHVLVAEDDRALRDSLVRVLRFEGYDVEAVGDGAKALSAADERLPDVVVMDVMMPVVDGLAACRLLRQRHRLLPILMLTARHEVADRVAGLDAGADDYLVKPFALDELLARLRALLRRSSTNGEDDLVEVGDLHLDVRRRMARRGERPMELTKTEFDLLALFMRNASLVLARDTIYDRIWGFDFETGSRSLDVYVGYLRRKTEQGGEPRLLHTVRGVGYVLRAP
jgi:two-component system response regulator MprA